MARRVAFQDAMAQVFAEAKIEYSDAITRKHRAAGKTMAVFCHCGRHVSALGLCAEHYFDNWERRRGVTKTHRERRGNVACGHMNRPHHARGLCSSCYAKAGKRNHRAGVANGASKS